MNNPLSPHLQIYRWQTTSLLSILHRISGVVSSLGSMIIIIYLLSIGLGEDTYKLVISISDNIFIRTVLIGLSFCIFFYILSSIRHLLWDYGYGLDLNVAKITGWTALSIAVILTICFWLILYGVI